jgi:tripartite-type tricarboxylate transporter receptor subunit TctC
MRVKLAAVLCAAALGLTLVGADAQETYPTHPILLTHGNTPGSNSDVMARIIADPLAARLGQPVIVESRPGAGQTLAFGRIASGTPDGYTLIMMHSGHPIAGAMYKSLKYDTVTDFQMLGTVILYPFVLAVRQDHPLKSMADLIAYAKANPDKINFASGGTGSPTHMVGELFKMMTGTKMVHLPYRGAGPALIDVLGGQVEVIFATLPSSIGHIRGGKLRALAVTLASRSDALPDVPAMREFVPGYDAGDWYGVGAPKNTPVEVVGRLNQEINAILADPKMKARMADLGMTVQISPTPADYAAFIADETEKWSKVVKFSGAKPD